MDDLSMCQQDFTVLSHGMCVWCAGCIDRHRRVRRLSRPYDANDGLPCMISCQLGCTCVLEEEREIQSLVAVAAVCASLASWLGANLILVCG